MPYTINGNTVITEGDATPASANASFRNFFYRYGLSPATYPGTVGSSYGYITGGVGTLLTATQAGNAQQGTRSNYPLYYANATSFSTTSVERFPFASFVNSVVVSGALSTTRASFASQSSKTTGYNSGGYLPIPVPVGSPAPNSYYTNVASSAVIDSFPFVSMGIITVSSVGSLSTGRFGCSGQQSDIEGFTSGGSSSNTTQTSTIDKFPFSSFTTATSVGNLSAVRTAMAGHSSPVSGYTSGGLNPIYIGAAAPGGSNIGTPLNTINRYPFAVSPVTASGVATLTTAVGYNAGGSSLTFGYSFGGSPAVTPAISTVERFNFSEQTVTVSAVPATLSTTRMGHSVISSSEYAYVCGGYNYATFYTTPGGPSPANVIPSPSPALSTIDVFPFASTTSTAGTISMTTGRGNIGGNQY